MCVFMVFWFVVRRLQQLGSALLMADATGVGRAANPPAALGKEGKTGKGDTLRS